MRRERVDSWRSLRLVTGDVDVLLIEEFSDSR